MLNNCNLFSMTYFQCMFTCSKELSCHLKGILHEGVIQYLKTRQTLKCYYAISHASKTKQNFNEVKEITLFIIPPVFFFLINY